MIFEGIVKEVKEISSKLGKKKNLQKRKSRKKALRKRGFFETDKAFPDCLERE